MFLNNDWMVLLQQQNQLCKVIETNQITQRFGQGTEDIKELMDLGNIPNLMMKKDGIMKYIWKP